MKRIIPLRTPQGKTITRKTEATRNFISPARFSFNFSPILSNLAHGVIQYTFEGG
jgi:hypothetical protein